MPMTGPVISLRAVLLPVTGFSRVAMSMHLPLVPWSAQNGADQCGGRYRMPPGYAESMLRFVRFPPGIGTYQGLDNMNQAVGPAPEPASQRQAAKHEWLRERLLQDIAGLHPRSPLPTERELASTYEVSRATVRQALAALEQSGTVYRVQGAGTFVAGPHVSKSLSLTSFSEDMRLRGLRPSSLVLAADEVPADAPIAADLQIPVAASGVRLVRVRLADESPMCLGNAFPPGRRGAGAR